jgi:hypothetical protein
LPWFFDGPNRNRWFTVLKNGGSFHGELLNRWYVFFCQSPSRSVGPQVSPARSPGYGQCEIHVRLWYGIHMTQPIVPFCRLAPPAFLFSWGLSFFYNCLVSMINLGVLPKIELEQCDGLNNVCLNLAHCYTPVSTSCNASALSNLVLILALVSLQHASDLIRFCELNGLNPKKVRDRLQRCSTSKGLKIRHPLKLQNRTAWDSHIRFSDANPWPGKIAVYSIERKRGYVKKRGWF